jgi:Protein of unknown function (DUF3040)
MSLAPSERRALARIESLLRSSDPGLATMLATFTHPAHLARDRFKRFIPVALAMAAMGLIIVGSFALGHVSRTSCGVRGAHASVVWQIDGCAGSPAGHHSA